MVNDPTKIQEEALARGQMPVIAALLSFTLVMGWRLLAGSVAPGQGYLWLGACCLCPIGWYCYGFLRITDRIQSNALLISAIGWVILAIGFLVHYRTLLEADPGTSLNQLPTVWLNLFSVIGLLTLIIAGFISWQCVSKPGTLEFESTP